MSDMDIITEATWTARASIWSDIGDKIRNESEIVEAEMFEKYHGKISDKSMDELLWSVKQVFDEAHRLACAMHSQATYELECFYYRTGTEADSELLFKEDGRHDC